ncbi:hypothetical protein AVEN_199566-1 [Araneus ventricosus]|uniref:Uncharacterized protein n=1 Tax=Araneus ventricosus TaxID=182803 RepID=A0A4Y2VD11_ARAVE|nr:hypothetical protein AVEN_146948-1 [Araneus ventricosus]GBO22409.1 hypothetical protein AVEN_199566-1 [Araneus ventricosus]
MPIGRLMPVINDPSTPRKWSGRQTSPFPFSDLPFGLVIHGNYVTQIHPLPVTMIPYHPENHATQLSPQIYSRRILWPGVECQVQMECGILRRVG